MPQFSITLHCVYSFLPRMIPLMLRTPDLAGDHVNQSECKQYTSTHGVNLFLSKTVEFFPKVFISEIYDQNF